MHSSWLMGSCSSWGRVGGIGRVARQEGIEAKKTRVSCDYASLCNGRWYDSTLNFARLYKPRFINITVNFFSSQTQQEHEVWIRSRDFRNHYYPVCIPIFVRRFTELPTLLPSSTDSPYGNSPPRSRIHDSAARSPLLESLNSHLWGLGNSQMLKENMLV